MAAKEYTKEQLLAYKDKDATAVQTRYADWLIDKLDLEFPNAKAEAAFREAVRLGTALRMIFQASPENQEARGEAKAEREAVAESKPAKGEPTEKPAKAAKKTSGKKAAAAPAPVEDEEDDADTAVQATPKPSAPKKAARAGGKAAPF